MPLTFPSIRDIFPCMSVTSFRIGGTITGDRGEAEVVQLYVNDRVSSVTTPVKALKAFAKVFLKSGESKQVSLAIAKSDLALWNKDMKRVIEPASSKCW